MPASSACASIGFMYLKEIGQVKLLSADEEIELAKRAYEADKAANEARVQSDTQIAQKNNELEIRRAELKLISDSKKAEADAAYKIQEQEQQKSIETATVNAQIAKAERDAELKKQEVEIAKQKLGAEIRAQADADRYAKEQEAQADLFRRQKDAEAKKFEQQQDAEARRVQAEATRFAREQEAEGIRATGLAEAEAIRARAMPTLIYYHTASGVAGGLASGEIDACLASSLQDVAMRTVAKFDTRSYYFATTKGNSDLLQELNTAMNSLKTSDPYFEEKVYAKYHGKSSEEQTVISQEEAAYVAGAAPIKVVYDPSWYPISYTDEHGRFCGAMPALTRTRSSSSR